MERKRKREYADQTKMDSLPKEDSLESALAEQRREFFYAKTLYSDLDLAFSLQLEEAVTASLAIHPCASQTQPDDGVVPIHADEDFDYVGLLLQDLERFGQERRDHEASENFMREIRRDLDRRVHDQKLAIDIMNMLDDEWKKDGDNFQRPYGTDYASSSSSSSSKSSELGMVNRESFKLNFKGLQSEERIKDKMVAVAGVGVAICDSRDNVILQVSKGLDVDGNERKKSEGVVELKALVEGLNAALSLDLKQVTILCDDYMVHQYATGRVLSKQDEMVTLVNQVSCLQKRFTDCQLSLVTRNNIKFAFKLAKDALVSRITWPVEISIGKRILKETCVICYEDTDVDRMFSVEGCLHRYCFSCMKQHVEAKFLNGMDAKCPHEGCKSEVSIDACGKFLNPRLLEIISQRKKEASIAIAEKVYCPYLKVLSINVKTCGVRIYKDFICWG